ncbi:MAG: hypothetical protein JNK02_12360 [Planctomycetes bacterium]|nr:hypothetical protein [Planctomycetota bacterium]
MPTPARLAILALALLASGCDEQDAVSIRVRLDPGLSGTLITSSLVQPAAPGEVENETRGVAFERSVGLRGAKGRFERFDGLVVGDVRFAAGTGDGGLSWARVEVPTGPDARWPNLFVPLSEAERRAAADAFEISSDRRDLGKSLLIRLELPAEAVSNGVRGKLRGSKNTSEGKTATLTVPLQAARDGREPLVWQITW